MFYQMDFHIRMNSRISVAENNERVEIYILRLM